MSEHPLIPAERLSAALNIIPIPDPEHVVHFTYDAIHLIVTRTVHYPDGGAVPDPHDPRRAATSTTVYVIDRRDTYDLDRTAVPQPIDTGKDGHA